MAGEQSEKALLALLHHEQVCRIEPRIEMAVLAPRISLCDTVSFSLQWVGAIGHRRFHWAEMYAILREA